MPIVVTHHQGVVESLNTFAKMDRKGSQRVKIGFSTTKLEIYPDARAPDGHYCATAGTESMFGSHKCAAIERHRIGAA